MKKQKKLALTITSLCLTVALMVFGVYSATNVTYSINSTVSYTFDDVLVDVTSKLYSVSTTNTAIIAASALDTMDADDWTEVSGGVTNGTLKSYTGSNGVYTQDDSASSGTASVNFNLNTSFAYKVETTFSTVSNIAIQVSYNSSAFVDPTGDDNIVLVVKPGADSEIVAGETYVFTYYVLLEDATKEVSATIPDLSFTVSKP